MGGSEETGIQSLYKPMNFDLATLHEGLHSLISIIGMIHTYFVHAYNVSVCTCISLTSVHVLLCTPSTCVTCWEPPAGHTDMSMEKKRKTFWSSSRQESLTLRVRHTTLLRLCMCHVTCIRVSFQVELPVGFSL